MSTSLWRAASLETWELKQLCLSLMGAPQGITTPWRSCYATWGLGLTATPNFRHGFWRQAQWSPAPFIRRDPKSVRLIRASLQPELKTDRETVIKGTTKKARWGLGLSAMVQLSSSPSFFLHNTHRQAADCAAPIDVCPHPPKKSLHTPPAPLHESNHR